MNAGCSWSRAVGGQHPASRLSATQGQLSVSSLMSPQLAWPQMGKNNCRAPSLRVITDP